SRRTIPLQIPSRIIALPSDSPGTAASQATPGAGSVKERERGTGAASTGTTANLQSSPKNSDRAFSSHPLLKSSFSPVDASRGNHQACPIALPAGYACPQRGKHTVPEQERCRAPAPAKQAKKGRLLRSPPWTFHKIASCR